jgi:hypothetical protein
MVMDPGYSLSRKKEEIKNTEIKIAYNDKTTTIDIGTVDGFYNIQVKLPPVAPEYRQRVERRAMEVFEFVKDYFIRQPEELHKLGYPLHVAMVNSTGTAVAFNISYVAKGTGGIQNPVNNI